MGGWLWWVAAYDLYHIDGCVVVVHTRDMNQMTDMHSQTYRAIDMMACELLDFMQRKDYNSALSALAAMGDVIRMTHLVTTNSEQEYGA